MRIFTLSHPFLLLFFFVHDRILLKGGGFMEIVSAKKEHIPQIEDIYGAARRFMRAS